MTSNIFKNNKGASLLWVTIFAGVMSVIVANMLTLIMAETKYTTNSDLSFKAYVAAKSGVEATLYELRKDISEKGIYHFFQPPVTEAYNTTYSLSSDSDGFDETLFEAKASFDWTNPV